MLNTQCVHAKVLGGEVGGLENVEISAWPAVSFISICKKKKKKTSIFYTIYFIFSYVSAYIINQAGVI